MKTFFCGHSVGQHVQANRTCQFTLKTSCRNCNFSVIGDGLLWSAVKFVEGKIPWPLHGISSHIQNNNGWNLDPSIPKTDSFFLTFVLSMLLLQSEYDQLCSIVLFFSSSFWRSPTVLSAGEYTTSGKCCPLFHFTVIQGQVKEPQYPQKSQV